MPQTETLNPAFATLLGLVFLPLAVLVATRVDRSLKPPRHRPLAFVFGGVLLLAFGLLGAYALRPFLQSGVVRFTSRHLGQVYIDAAQDPLAYWAAILSLYGLAVLVAAVGLAGLGLAFRGRRR